MKNLKKTLACLLSVALVAGLSALSASAATEKLEAENGTLGGTAAVVTTPTAGEDVSGGAFVGSIGADTTGSPDNYVEFTVNSGAAGTATLTVAGCSWVNRNVDVLVNGTDAYNVAIPGNGSNWNGDVVTASIEITVKEGANTIKLMNTATVPSDSTGWAPNIDYIEVTTPDAAAGGDTTPETPESPETGDATLVAVAVAVVALAGVAVVAKKRHTAE